MSADADDSDAIDVEPHAAADRYSRKADISRGTVSHVKPITHAVRGNFLIRDHDRPAPSNAPDRSSVPDGSLYQQCRVEWLTAPDERRETYEDSRGREHEAVILERDAEFSTIPDDEQESAVVLTSSNWTAGTGEGDDYTPWYSYRIARRPIDDDGEIRFDGSPRYTMTAVIEPQYDELVYKDGNEYTLPYGEGTHVKARVNYVENNSQVFTRIHELVRVGLDYSINYDDVLRSERDDYTRDDDLEHDGKSNTNESRDLTRIEQYARVNSAYMDELRETISQSLDLIPTKGGRTDVIRGGSDDDGNWRRYGFITSDWDLLGYPDMGDLEVGLKVYVDNPDAPEPYCHPKIEAWVAGKNGEQLKWTPRDWDAINAALREIVISHLHHAGVSEHDLEPDAEFEPVDRDEFRGKHPANRREWLRAYYADLKSSVEHEVRRTRTDLSRDILRAVIYEGRDLTLGELAERTGATKRAISRRVKQMEETGDPDEPGIVERVHSHECHVTMSREMRDHVAAVLNATHPDETWSDVVARAEERRRRRRDRAERDDDQEGDAIDDDQEDVDGDRDVNDESSSTSKWEYLSNTALNGDDLASALNREFLEQRDVRVNTKASPALFGEG